MADPLFPNPSDADPTDWIINQRRLAQSTALQGLDGSADDAVRAHELGQATGTPPELVYGDLENFEKQHKAALTSALLTNNQFLRDIANSQPLAGEMYQNDWGHLDEVSQRLKSWNVPGHVDSILSNAVKAFYNKMAEPREPEEETAAQVQFRQDHPHITSLLDNPGIRVPAEAVHWLGEFAGRATEAGFAAIHEGLKTATMQNFGWDENRAESFSREMQGILESEISRNAPEMIPEVAKQNAELLRSAAPWVRDGKEPPVGIHEDIDKAHAEQAKLDVKNLDDIFKEVQKVSIRDTAPEFLAQTLRLGSDADIEISADAIRKLYGDKVPTKDDNILGGVAPDLATQLAAVEQYGGRVSVPLADYLAKVDPEVHKALHDDTALRPGGMTTNETKPPVKEGDELTLTTEAKPAEKPPPIDTLDAIRRSSGMDPVGEPARIRLVRVASDDLTSDVHQFDFIDAQGKRIGGLGVTENPPFGEGELFINTITAGTKEGIPGFLGTRQLSSMLRQLQQEFPNARWVSGYRISGARSEPVRVRIPLRKATPDDLSALIGIPREGPRTVRSAITGTTEVSPIFSTSVSEVLPKSAVESATDSPILKYLGSKISELAKDVPVHIISNKDMMKVYGDPDTLAFHYIDPQGFRAIYLPEDIGEWSPAKALHVIAHEAAHAITVGEMAEFPALNNLVVDLKNHVSHEMALNAKAARAEHWYAFTNEKEFIAEAMSKEGFQSELEKIPLSPELAQRLGFRDTKNAWEAFKNIVKDLWRKLTGKEPPETAMDAIFALGNAFETAGRILDEKYSVSDLSAIKGGKEPELPGLTRMEDREAFERASDIGMTTKEWRLYQQNIREQHEADLKHFQARAEKLERARQTDQWKTDEKRILAESKESLLNRPDIAVDNFLREGTLFGDKLKGRPRLDSDRLSAEQKALLPDDYHKPGGMHPDDVARNFGYQSVDQMLDHLSALHVERGSLGPNEHVNGLAERMTRDRMNKEFGNLEANILEGAKDHVMSKTQFDIMDQEMFALAAKNNAELPFTKQNIDSWVKKQFDSLPISGHDRDAYLAAAGRNGRVIEQSLAAKDYTEALKAFERRSIALRYAKLAGQYEKERASFDKLAKNLSKREVTGLPEGYLAHLRDQLLKAGLSIGRTVQGLSEDVAANGGDLKTFVENTSGQSQVPILLPDWMYGQWKKPLNEMTAGEFSEFSNAIRQLYNFGRDENKINLAGKKLEAEQFRDDAVGQLSKQADMPFYREIPRNRSRVGKLMGGANNIWQGYLQQVESLFNRWDLGDSRGLFNTLFGDAAAAANHWSSRIRYYSGQLNQAAQLVKGLDMKARLPDLLQRKTADRPYDLNRENAMRIIMDMGNPSNAGKFIRGWGVDPTALQDWLTQNTTKEMWDYAERIGQIHEEIFQELKEMIRSVGGTVPDRVELVPFTDPHGVQRRGWYSPMIYDQVELGKSRKLAGLPEINPNDMIGLMDTGYFKATTVTGAEIARTGYAAPTDLTFDRMIHQMNKLLYDAAFRPFVINFGKLMRDDKFLNAMTKYAGESSRNMVKDWYRDIVGVGKGVSTSADQTMGIMGEYLRRNIVGQLIGWNIHTAEKHGLSAMATSLAEVGPVNFAREFINLTRVSPDLIQSNWDFASGKSEEIQRRTQHWIDTFGGQTEMLRQGTGGWRNWMLEKGSAVVAFSDLLSTKASWNAKYKEVMAELGRDRPGEAPESYEGIAIRQADAVVRRAHGSTALTSRPGLMRGGNPLVRSFASLYSFFNQMLQRNYEAMWRTQYAVQNFKEGDYAKGLDNVKRISTLVATSVLWPALVEEMVTPYTGSDKDGWGKWSVKTLENGLSSMVPFARDFVHGWVNGWPLDGGVFETAMRDLAESMRDIAKGSKSLDAEHGGKTIKDFNAVLGVATGVTNNEVGNVLKTIWDSTHRSKESPRGTGELARELTTGRARVRK